MDLGGKPVACFGVGDSANYGDYYCDALEEIYSIFRCASCSSVLLIDGTRTVPTNITIAVGICEKSHQPC